MQAVRIVLVLLAVIATLAVMLGVTGNLDAFYGFALLCLAGAILLGLG